jgi:hypothetical protein
MVPIVQWIDFAVYVALALALVAKYARTRDAGFLWLGVAVILWPLAAYWLDRGEGVLLNRVVHGERIAFYPFSQVASGRMTVGELVRLTGSIQQLIGAALMLVAVLYLGRTKRAPELQPAS